MLDLLLMVLLFVAVSAAVLPAASPFAPSPLHPLLKGAFVVTLLAVAGLTVSIRPRESALPESRPLEEPNDNYVQSDSCRSCHPSQYASWYGSYHRTMTQVATEEAVLGDFEDVKLESAGWGFHLHRRDDAFHVTMNGPEGSGEDGGPARYEYQVVLSTGSHHMQVYWLATGKTRLVGSLPFVYLRELEQWFPRSAAFLRPPVVDPRTKAGDWNDTCIRCHTTHGLPRLDESGADSRAVEFGIACESCHGPGAAHVQSNRNPIRRYSHRKGEKNVESTIVHPARLDHRRVSQVCGHCHSVNEPRERDDWAKNGFRYRPGDDLHSTRTVLRGHSEQNPDPVSEKFRQSYPELMENTFWSDGMVRVTGREYNALLETPCFQRGELSCLSCHQMHKNEDDPRTLEEWADDQLKTGMRENDACTQCHREYIEDDRLAAHTMHGPRSTGSLCYNCHMPYTTWGLMGAIRSHQVDSPDVGVSLETGRPNACNLCHLDKTLSWTGEQLFERYAIEPPALVGDDALVAASVKGMLSGDANQRALWAWATRWEPARKVSGTGWMLPSLAKLLSDPYELVRWTAFESIRTLPGFSGVRYSCFGEPESRQLVGEDLLQRWINSIPASSFAGRRELLIRSDGTLDHEGLARLYGKRNDRWVNLRE